YAVDLRGLSHLFLVVVLIRRAAPRAGPRSRPDRAASRPPARSPRAGLRGCRYRRRRGGRSGPWSGRSGNSRAQAWLVLADVSSHASSQLRPTKKRPLDLDSQQVEGPFGPYV